MFIKAADIEAKVQPRPSTLKMHLSVARNNYNIYCLHIQLDFINVFQMCHVKNMYKSFIEIPQKQRL